MLILRITLCKKSHFSVYQKCSVTQKYAKNAFLAGAPPRTPLGSSRRLPRLLSRLGGDTPPWLHLTQHLRCFDRRAGARHLCPHPSLVAPNALGLATGLLQRLNYVSKAVDSLVFSVTSKANINITEFMNLTKLHHIIKKIKR